MSFSSQLRRFARKTGERNELVLKKVGIELFRRVIMRTPVDTGRLRANWQATIGAAASGELDETDSSGQARPDGGGSSKTTAKMQAVVLGADVAKPIYLTNNLPYAAVIEFGGSKQQAPAGMARVSVQEFQDIVRGAVK
jgi:hypothetical protein